MLLNKIEKAYYMNISAMDWLGLTTLILVTVTIFAAMDLAFNWIFYLTVLGQVSLVVTVYKVLRDDYTTEKTFKDFYEDQPMPGNWGWNFKIAFNQSVYKKPQLFTVGFVCGGRWITFGFPYNHILQMQLWIPLEFTS